MGTIRKTLVRTSLAIGGTIAMVMAMATTASAVSTPRNGHCEPGEFCLYYGNGETGSVSDFNGSVADYGRTQPTCYDFKGAGLGKGKCVWNDAASAKNNTTGHTIFLYFADTHFALSVGQSLNINNRDTSHKFIAN
ncbi:peptidase inhibitor family I36 protein [Amycolatopsis sp. WQ 127309]|uniref:peptidase inhibitor family I36 protein n=1 Tax=Amycolatopsis sp. WQ 127309 TaxID=2932773 RepID=UPI001FF20D8F|nr:peptidase inhibitor family I36 protein [Amycolatopsis sp. WQ 127309]UOZ05403.1 peptidase inhibitor family I36 protein [Amycolatopsis sp. WQ 127309]